MTAFGFIGRIIALNKTTFSFFCNRGKLIFVQGTP